MRVLEQRPALFGMAAESGGAADRYRAHDAQIARCGFQTGKSKQRLDDARIGSGPSVRGKLAQNLGGDTLGQSGFWQAPRQASLIWCFRLRERSTR